ncbi:hypothetical protein E5225_12185 [Cellulomonas shaoxiangyii]|uniref:Uncharacterized protein n=1 Tax=Cellulomonas shaoxiangyii TaxID=2566013 RepID=A0A4P7SM87_9CELL|nr:hypothetical protein E5225_12185 [Cellulomonas shaoxiangyii]TGY86740.1 hypothetical protein E5226_01145 [Cellulomonas shaoxiangyii]
MPAPTAVPGSTAAPAPTAVPAPAAVPAATTPAPGAPGPAAPGPGATRLTLETRRFWSGAAATALVAALVGVVGVLVLERILGVELTVGGSSGSAMATYVLGGSFAALVAAGLLHALVLTTPRPRAFFGWILALATLLATLLPLTSSGGFGSGIATGVVNLLVGVAVWSLLSGVLGWTVRRVPA